MLNRIFVGLAIVASIFVAAFGFFSVKPKIETIVQQRDSEKKEKLETQEKLRKTERDLKSTQTNLKNTQDQLNATKTERDSAVAEAKKQSARAESLKADYTKAAEERDVARAELFVWKQLGVTPDQIKGMIQHIQDLITLSNEHKLVIKGLIQTTNQLQVKLDGLLKQDYKVPLPPELRGKVLAVDPKWEFVVLNFGKEQGALEDGELLVHRNGQVIAKVRIKSLEANQCIANVVSGYRLHDLLEGDAVFPANN